MFHRIALGSVLVTAVGLVPSVAVAAHGASPADSSFVTVNRGLPSGWTFGDIVDCQGPQVTGATYRHIDGPDAGGDGALEMTVPAGGSAALTIPLSGASMASLTNFTIETQQPAASTGPTMTSYLNILGDLTTVAGYHYRLAATIEPGVTEFHGLDFLGTTMNWLEGPNGGEALLKGNGNYATFLSSPYNTMYPATPRSIEYRFDNCSGTVAQALDIDDLIVGIDGTSTLYSLNAPTAPDLGPHLSAAKVVAGKIVTPSVTVTDAGSPIAGAHVALLKKAAGASKFTAASMATTNGAGVATAPAQQPRKNTTYEWYFTAADGYALGLSAPLVVKVAPKVSLFLAKQVVTKGKPLKASGTVDPKTGGSTITLWRKKGAGKVKLATTAEKRNGFFMFSKVLPKGSYTLFATSKKTATNTGGTSATKTFAVVK